MDKRTMEIEKCGNEVEFIVPSRMSGEGLSEKVRTEKTSERGKGRGRGFYSVGRASVLSRIYYVCMLYMIPGSSIMFLQVCGPSVCHTNIQRLEVVMT